MRDLLAVAGIILCIAASLLTGTSLAAGFLAAIFLSGIVQSGNFKWKEALVAMKRAVLEVKILYIVILLIGASVSAWLSGGVVQTLMVYGLKAMLGRNVVLMTFFITGISGYFMGTAIGTISTLGIAILGIGAAFGIPVEILLGAAVSGAFISDKISPLSGLMNLTLAGTGASYKNVVKAMLQTLVPVVALSALFYGIVGQNYVNADLAQVVSVEMAMREGFMIHPMLLILPVLVVAMSFSGKPSYVSIGSGVLAGCVFSVVLQGNSLLFTLKALLFGFKAHTGDALLDSILKSGGTVGMIEVILIVMGAVALSELLECTGMNRRLFGKFFDTVKTDQQLLFRSGMLSMLLTALTCDQTAGIVLPLKILKQKGSLLGVRPEHAARIISDTGTIIAPLMPWNINALIIIGITGIGAVEYGPYAVLCAIAPVWAILNLLLSNKISYISKRNAA